MSVRCVLILSAVTICLSACGDNPDDQLGTDCPQAKPDEGASCTVTERCEYFKEATQCNYLDLYWHCDCTNGGWSCTSDLEDCPCPETAPQSGDTCAFPGPSSCEYAEQTCTCDGTSWTCPAAGCADWSSWSCNPTEGAACEATCNDGSETRRIFCSTGGTSCECGLEGESATQCGSQPFTGDPCDMCQLVLTAECCSF